MDFSPKQKNIMKKIIPIILFCLLINIASATNYIVTNTNDAGTGSLREQITYANAFPGTHSISFNIPTSDINYNAFQGVWTIHILSTLPYITKANLNIDGATQTTNQGNTNVDGPEIVIDGNNIIDYGFFIYNVAGVTINSFVISNFLYGIEVTGSNAQNIVIKGNYVGVNYNATDSASNYIGIEIIGNPHNNTVGGSTAAERNIVSGNAHIGIRVVNSNYNTITGNYVGTNRTATASLGNYDGISIEGTAKFNIIGGITLGERNIVSGNVAYGIPVFGAGCDKNKILGNYIGTDITGSYAIPNTYGILFDDGAKYNIIGGRLNGAGNLISGNSGYGIFLYNNMTNSDTTIGNIIGANANGTFAIPNANGIVIDGIPKYQYIDSNLISGNLQHGIVIHATGTDYNTIIRNKIGTTLSGTTALPNGIDGIRISEGPQHNIIGGDQGKGNIIAFNGGVGVSVMTTSDDYNKISANSIFGNAGLGIELYPIGPNVNDAGDADSGPNQEMNYPMINFAEYNPYNIITTVNGNISTIASNFVKIEFFISDNDASNYGEGKTYLGYTIPDVAGNFTASLYGITSTDKITATAIDSSGNSSEFSANYQVSLFAGINNLSDNPEIKIFPNPAKNLITISGIENSEIRILNIQGQLLKTIPLSKSIENIDLSKFVNGIYIVQIKNSKEVFVKKLVKE
jgi:parallel beta-helix repeat protein